MGVTTIAQTKISEKLDPPCKRCYCVVMKVDQSHLPVWERTDGKFCARCGVLHYYSHKSYCSDCYKVVRKESVAGALQRQAKQYAYTHVIRNRYSGDLYKWDMRCGRKLPDGYLVVFETGVGEILPRVYWKLEEFSDGKT